MPRRIKRGFDCRKYKSEYPCISTEGVARLPTAVEQGLTTGGEDRGVLTFRRIARHYDGSNGSSRCPSLPALCAPGAASNSNRPPSPCTTGASSSHDVVTVFGTSAADVDSAGDYPQACFPTWFVSFPRAGAADNEREVVVGMRLAELQTLNGSKRAFMMLRQPLNEDQLEPHTPTPARCFRLVSPGSI